MLKVKREIVINMFNNVKIRIIKNRYYLVMYIEININKNDE